MSRITPQIIKECKIAEAWWEKKMPEIKAASDKRLEQWREEEEQKRRWKELVV